MTGSPRCNGLRPPITGTAAYKPRTPTGPSKLQKLGAGTLEIDRDSSYVADDGAAEVTATREFGRSALREGEELQPYHWLGFWHESRHFIDCVKEGRQPSSNFADAVESMALVERIRAAWPG